MKLKTSEQFYETFYEHKLWCYWHTVHNFDSGYAARGVIYTGKSFIKLKPVVNVIKRFGIIMLQLVYCLTF
jgi:hypothetical protein